MGNRISFRGDMTIPKEKLPEFTERVLTILRQGGMMGIERVELYGKRIALLTPPVPDEAGKVVCRYNYFEDDGWDSICYDTKTGQFKSRDVGCLQFCEVVCAVYVLYEFYAAGVAYRDGEPFDKRSYIDWLNYLFDEEFSDRQTDSNTPVEKIPTVLFLSCEGSFGDDQLPLWKPASDVCIFPGMRGWLQELREELEAIRVSTEKPLGNQTMLEVLVDTLDKAKEYGHLYASREMFYNFATHPDDRERQAAVALLQRLVEKGLVECGIPLSASGTSWRSVERGLRRWDRA